MRAPALALALALAVATPLANASWSVWGSTEPDTTFDESAPFIWRAPDTDPSPGKARVYFDVVAEATPTGQNPNALTVGLTHARTPGESYTAFFGAWKDCNADGYVGMAAGALIEYRSDLLLSGSSICPQGGPWNDGLWVVELRPIGPATDTRSPGNFSYVIPRLINDTGAQVWGDQGAPRSAAGAAPTCPLAPLPRGTTASTTGLLAYADCADGYTVRDQRVVPDVHAPASLYGDPATGGVGLLQRDSHDEAFSSFDCARPKGGLDVRDPSGGPRSVDADDPTPNHLLTGSIGPEGIAQVAPFQNPDGGAGHYHRQLSDDEGSYVWLAAFSPHVEDPAGSYADGASVVERALVEKCDPRASALPLYQPGQAVDFAPAVEQDVRGFDPALGKRQNDIVFDLTQFTSSYQEGGTAPDGRTGAPFVADLLGHSMPQDGGLAVARDAGGSGPGWHSLNAAPLRAASWTRADLDPVARSFLTFYARVSLSVVTANDLQLPAGNAVGTYGAEWCGTATSGLHEGWDCAASHWWRAPDASARPQNAYSHRPLGALVGDEYQLRDVDCESDGTLPGGADCSGLSGS